MKKKVRLDDVNEYINTVSGDSEEQKEESIVTDPFGSYTGVTAYDPYDRPVQDSDDL